MDNNENVINIYYAADRNYFKHCIISITSVILNHKSSEKLSFHILHSDLSEAEFEIAENLKADCDFSIDFIKVTSDNFKKYTCYDMWHLSINAFYRFLIPDLSDAPKAIYLDDDLVLTGDVSELYNQDINGFKAGVIEDKVAKGQVKKLGLKSDKYFNSGVLLLNLEEIKKTDLLKETAEYNAKNKDIITYHDQDILNGIWDCQVKFLEDRFNAQSYAFLRMKSRYKKMGISRIKNPLIIHYTGTLKPWGTYCRHKRACEWMKYWQKTPFKLSKKELFIFYLKRFASDILWFEREKNLSARLVMYLFGIKIKLGAKKRA